MIVCMVRGALYAQGELIDSLAASYADSVPVESRRHRRDRDGLGYHITIAAKCELACMDTVLRRRLLEEAAHLPFQGIVVLGLGAAFRKACERGGAGGSCHFLAVQWPEAQRLRARAELQRADLHVTLGFNPVDLHRPIVRKGARQLLRTSSTCANSHAHDAGANAPAHAHSHARSHERAGSHAHARENSRAGFTSMPHIPQSHTSTPAQQTSPRTTEAALARSSCTSDGVCAVSSSLLSAHEVGDSVQSEQESDSCDTSGSKAVLYGENVPLVSVATSGCLLADPPAGLPTYRRDQLPPNWSTALLAAAVDVADAARADAEEVEEALCVIEELIAAADATRGRLLQAQLLCVRARVLARAARLAEALEDAEEACACAHAHACACSCAGACANACQTVSAGHPMPNPPAIDSVAREALLLRGSVLFAMRRKREARVTLEQLVHALSTCNVRARGESVCDDDKLGGRLAETSLQAASIDTSESLELERAAMQRERAMRLLERC